MSRNASHKEKILRASKAFSTVGIAALVAFIGFFFLIDYQSVDIYQKTGDFKYQLRTILSPNLTHEERSTVFAKIQNTIKDLETSNLLDNALADSPITIEQLSDINFYTNPFNSPSLQALLTTIEGRHQSIWQDYLQVSKVRFIGFVLISPLIFYFFILKRINKIKLIKDDLIEALKVEKRLKKAVKQKILNLEKRSEKLLKERSVLKVQVAKMQHKLAEGLSLPETFKSLLHESETAAAYIDKDGNIKNVNRAFVMLTGYSAVNEQSRNILPFSIHLSEELHESLSADLSPFTSTLTIHSNKEYWVLASLSSIRDKDQKGIGHLLLLTNLTSIREDKMALEKKLDQANLIETELKIMIDKQLETNEQLLIAESEMKGLLEKEQESKAVLNQTLDVLKDTQGQLVHSEKMASLGQLTAGIAHEINNPINFIYNGIGSLQQSLDEISMILDQYEQIDSEEDVQKHRELIDNILSLKSEYDYQTLREDLNEMIVDIKEGAIRTIEIVKGLRVFSRLDEEEQKEANINECLMPHWYC